MAAALQGILSAHAQAVGTPALTMTLVNETLVRRAVDARFATMVYGVVSRDGQLTYCNAGHNPPVLLGRRGLRRLETGGAIIGVFRQTRFQEEILQLDPGDTLVVFSDGLTEALNCDDHEFGEERLLSCLQANGELPASQLLECLLDDVRQFTVGAEQSDDLTVMVLRYLGA
jgi:sigma-B regulation protein RsbU (phosphoserine phosphatase)